MSTDKNIEFVNETLKENKIEDFEEVQERKSIGSFRV